MLTDEEREECRSLKQWSNSSKGDVDAVIEWLATRGYLNKKGLEFEKRFVDFAYYGGKRNKRVK